MSEVLYKFHCNFNRVECKSWIDTKRNPDGTYSLIGMGMRTEYDHETGAVISRKIEPTGLEAWAPHNAFGEPRTFNQWLNGLLPWIRMAA